MPHRKTPFQIQEGRLVLETQRSGSSAG